VLSAPGPDQNVGLPTRARLGCRRLWARARGVITRSPNNPALGPRSSLSPWWSVALLWLLFELPRVFSAALPDLSALSFSLELPLLLTLAALNTATVDSALARRCLALLAGLLIALRIDQWICWLLMREEPLLYDQWFMARHLWVLIGDLMSLVTLAVLAGVALLSWLATRAVRRLLRSARRLLEPARRRRTLWTGLALWTLALSLSVLAHGSKRPRVTWLTPALIANLVRSRAVYLSVQTESHSSPYAHFASIELADKPDVLLFIVESYGRLLSVEPETGDAHRALLGELSAQLARAGWHAASAFSTSPVSGGRSWLAEGTMLMGLPVRYESVFQHLIGQRPQPPHLVSWLRRQGYHTTLLAPADRNRPGAYVVNRYGFAQLLTNNDLGYRGASMGWGIVPDQYSLAIAEERVLEPARARRQPVFLDFHMVSSHAPWADIPPLYEDPSHVERSDAPREEHATATGTVLRRLSRFDRRAERRFPHMDHFDTKMRDGYAASIAYDLRVIAQYLARRPDDALVILIGDHQPPVISRSDESFDAPVHLLSRDPRRLQTALARGFRAGLTLPSDAAPALSHAELFPFLVDTLSAQHGALPSSGSK